MGICLAEWDRVFLKNSKGSYGTRNCAISTWRTLDKFINKMGWIGVTPISITPKQIRLFLEHQSLTCTDRTIQNQAAHIRRALRGAGRKLGNIRDPKNPFSPERLNIKKASRIGGRPAINMALHESLLSSMPEEIRILTGLQINIGLRLQEAIMAGPSLKNWLQIINKPEFELRGGFLPVRHGSKGGRPRFCFIFSDRRIIMKDLICSAIELLKNNKLLQKKSLKTARNHYSHCLRKLGLVGCNSSHSLRRRFAQDQYLRYRESIMDESTALINLSQDLGHGDGRGRWVHNNYLSGGEGPLPIENL